MAITKTITLQPGVIIKDAYIRVDAFYGSKKDVTYSANAYVNEAAFREGVPYLQQDMLNFAPDSSPDAPSVWEQCYNHLVSLQNYTGASPA